MTYVCLQKASKNGNGVHFTARILRAIRIAARLGFSLTKDVAVSVKELSSSLLRLDPVYLSFFSLVRPSSCEVWTEHLLSSSAVKGSDGNQLYAGLWVCRSFFKVVMEIWSHGDSSTYPGRPVGSVSLGYLVWVVQFSVQFNINLIKLNLK